MIRVKHKGVARFEREGVFVLLFSKDIISGAELFYGKVVRDIYRWYLDGASVLGIIRKLHDAGVPSPTGKEKWNKHMIETMLSNEKYTGTVTLLDSATQEYAYQMKECIPPIITESEFRAVQDSLKARSNVTINEDGERCRKSTKYSSKRNVNN